VIEILNNASEEEAAIIVSAVRSLLNKKDFTSLKMPVSTEWDIYKTRRNLINNRWENKSTSKWILNSRTFE